MNGLSINVYGLKISRSKEEKIVPIYLSENISRKPTIHIFMMKKLMRNDDHRYDSDNGENVDDDNVIYYFA